AGHHCVRSGCGRRTCSTSSAGSAAVGGGARRGRGSTSRFRASGACTGDGGAREAGKAAGVEGRGAGRVRLPSTTAVRCSGGGSDGSEGGTSTHATVGSHGKAWCRSPSSQ